MFKIKYILVVLLHLVPASSNAQDKNKAVMFISQTRQGNEIFFNYQDIYNDIIHVDFRKDSLTSNLPPFVNVTSNYPILFKFNAASKQYPLYASPGDVVYVNTDKSNKDYYKFTADKDHFKYDFFSHLDAQGVGLGYPDAFGRTLKASSSLSYAEVISEIYNKRLKTLTDYSKNYKLNKEFYSFAISLINQYYVQALLAPYWRSPQEYLKYPPEYISIIRKSPLRQLLEEDKWVLSSPTYRAMVMSYIRFLSKEKLSTPQEFEVCYRNASDSLNGRARDYVLFNLMRNNINEGKSDYLAEAESFKVNCSFSLYKRYIDSLVSKYDAVVTNPRLTTASLVSSNEVETTWGDILQRNKGNVLYIDMWASWCGPCLAQVPFSKKLEQELAGKPVKFISISLDTDKAKWLKALDTNSLNTPGAQHYLLNPKSNLAAYLNAPPVPLYLLIDRHGRMISLNATRPQDPKTSQELQRLTE